MSLTVGNIMNNCNPLTKQFVPGMYGECIVVWGTGGARRRWGLWAVWGWGKTLKRWNLNCPLLKLCCNLRRKGDPDDSVSEIGHRARAGQTQLGGVASSRSACLQMIYYNKLKFNSNFTLILASQGSFVILEAELQNVTDMTDIFV